jgi:branched-chain amino acid transport system substrate-binding protein
VTFLIAASLAEGREDRRDDGIGWDGKRAFASRDVARDRAVIARWRGKAAAVILGIAAVLMPLSASRAEPGVFADRIVFGQSAAFQGPTAALGLGMREGILAAFKEANTAGGVNGRRLDLISYNDGYEPDKAIANTNRLIDKDKVFALVGEVGTPTSHAAQPIATAADVPFIGPFTGAAFLRNPSLGNVINVRASYDQETEAWIEHLTTDLGLKRIAILYQDDSYGRAGRSGMVKALAKREMKLVGEGTYMRNTTAVKTALLEIRKANPQAVGMVGAYAPCAEFIKLAREIGSDWVFVNISFVGPDALAKALGKEGQGVVITTVVPFPEDSKIPLVAQYQKALKAADPGAAPGFVSLEGYMVGRLVVQALEREGKQVTRAGLLATIKKVGIFDLGGVTLHYSATNNQGMQQVFLTEIEADGGIKPVSRLQDLRFLEGHQ